MGAIQTPSYSLLIVAFSLVSSCLEHLRLSLDENRGAYDFWSNHHRLEKTILKISAGPWASSRRDITAWAHPMFILSHLTLIGVVILLHKTLIAKAKKAKFPEALASQSRRRCSTAAMDISSFLAQTDSFRQGNVNIIYPESNIHYPRID